MSQDPSQYIDGHTMYGISIIIMWESLTVIMGAPILVRQESIVFAEYGK